jgi:hypothetical protein
VGQLFELKFDHPGLYASPRLRLPFDGVLVIGN